MDESSQRHLDAAKRRWEREESIARKWSILLRMLPYVAVSVFLLLAISVFP